MKRKRKLKKWVIPTAICLFVFAIPSVFAFYLYEREANMKTKFEIEFEDSIFVRATVLTYWESKDNGNMVGKSSWNLKNNVISSNWTKIDDYYYFNGFMKNDEIVDGIPINDKLINPNLSLEELSDDDLTNSKYLANYKVVYEFIEIKAKGNVLSCEDAWGIEYSSNGVPSKIQ